MVSYQKNNGRKTFINLQKTKPFVKPCQAIFKRLWAHFPNSIWITDY